MKKLNRVATMWVAALRSGDTKQTRNRLGTMRGSRCCLGVLCDLAVKEGIILSFRNGEQWLPEKVARWAGINTFAQYGPPSIRQRSLVEDNDKSKCSFAQIADIIELNAKSLFNRRVSTRTESQGSSH
jgi:hypothetical protein